MFWLYLLLFVIYSISKKAFFFPLPIPQPNCDLEPKLFKQWPKQQPKKKESV